MNQSRVASSAPLYLALICFILFVFLAIVTLGFSINGIDNAGILLASSLHSDILTSIMKTASFLGEEVVMVPLSLILILAGLYYRYRAEVAVFALAMVGGQLIKEIFKMTIGRPRPVGHSIVDLPTSFSFPSGHAMLSLIFFGILCFFVSRFQTKGSWSKWFTVVSVVCVFVISFSRVYLGVHYATDVLAGLLLGTTWTLLLGFFYDRFKTSKLKKEKTSTIPRQF